MATDESNLRKRHVATSTKQQEEVAEIKSSKKDPGTIKLGLVGFDLVLESLLGYVLWSVIVSVAPRIWFYPLNELEITGYEALALVLLSPILTGIPSIKVFVTSHLGLTFLRGMTVLGILSFHAPTTLSRLILNSVNVIFATLWLTGVIHYPDTTSRDVLFGGLILGYILKLVFCIGATTLNIIWTSATANVTICCISLIIVFIRHFRMQSSNISTLDSTLKSKKWLIIAIGFGSWLFLVQLLFGEVSVLLRWCTKAVPDNIFAPNPYGIVVLMSLVLGVMLSMTTFPHTLCCWIIACLAAAVFYYAHQPFAFPAGCLLATYTMFVFPRMMERMSLCASGRSVSLAFLTSIIFLLGSVWTVAYNFVPGGEYTREGNHVLLAMAMLLIGAGSLCSFPTSETEKMSDAAENVVEDASHGRFMPQRNEVKKVIVAVSFAFLLIGSGCMWLRYNNREKNRGEHEKRKSSVFSASIWTVHFGFDNVGWSSFERAADFMNRTDADIMGILESDCSRPYLGSTDFVQYVEEKLGLYSDFGPSTKDHTWGAGILSRYPIINSTHHLLPSPKGELAPAVSAVIDINGNHITFVVLHMGNDVDDLDRRLQAEEISKIMDECNTPVVLLGYITSSPGSRDYRQLTEGGRTKDIDADDFDRWCEYIFYRGLIRLGFARISRATLSDTELQMARFRIPEHSDKYKDLDFKTINKHDVDEEVRFPDSFEPRKDHSYYGPHHYYHLGTPRYFT